MDIFRRGSLKALSIALLVSVVAWAQTTATQPNSVTDEPSGRPTFRSDVKIVLVPVVVRNAAGHPVGSLTPDDFQLYDKGKRQRIASFSTFESGNNNNSTRANSGELITGATALPNSVEPKKTGAQQRRRYVAYVFDNLNTGFANFSALREAAIQHFKPALPPGDLAGIYTFSNRTSLEFTDEAEKLKDAVAKLRERPIVGHGEATPCPNISYYLAHQIVVNKDDRALEAATRQTMNCAHLPHPTAQNLAEATAKRGVLIGEQDTQVWIATLRRVIRLLQHRSGQRLIVLASSGFFAQTPEGLKGLTDTLDLAARAEVTISTLDARGVYIPAPADATRSSAPSNIERQYYRDGSLADTAILADLPAGTGGSFFQHDNDLAAGLRQLASPPEFSYVIGFSPLSLKSDGSFHPLKVRLMNRGGLTVQARSGYYAPEDGRSSNLADQLDDAVFSREELTGIPLDVASQISRSGTAPRKLSVVAKVQLKPLKYQHRAGRNHDILTVASVVFDEDGGYVEGTRNIVNLMLRNETIGRSDDPGVSVQSNFEDMKPGTYLVRVVVAESGGHAVAAHTVKVLVR